MIAYVNSFSTTHLDWITGNPFETHNIEITVCKKNEKNLMKKIQIVKSSGNLERNQSNHETFGKKLQ